MTQNEDAAWDVVQETWVAIIKGLPRLRDVVAFPRWAFRITTNKCIDWLRRKIRERELSKSFAEANRGVGIKKSSDSYDNLRTALEKLPRDLCVILSLHYVEGFNIAELADILEIPEGTVKSRLHHARRKLKELLENL